MKDQLVSFGTAKLAKEKGFGLEKNDYVALPTVYELDGSLYNDGKLTGTVSKKLNSSPNHLGQDTIDDFKASVFCLDNSLDDYILAPTQSLLQKWLRENHKLLVFISVDIDGKFYWYISTNRGKTIKVLTREDRDSFYKTYEKALEEGLQESLKLIKK